jgi:hypothetical protein
LDKIDRDFVGILNVLSLLREKPMTYDEIWKTKYFKTQNKLDFALRRLKEGCCIEKIKAVGIYCILGHGITLLTFYPTWKPLPVEVLDIVVPIGEGNEDRKGKRSRDEVKDYGEENLSKEES